MVALAGGGDTADISHLSKTINGGSANWKVTLTTAFTAKIQKDRSGLEIIWCA